ncbi:MAG: O-antigen ligase family protein [Roseburia sp.]|nr:O-antigen ligase family protein [Roseburia sp.]
MDTSLKNIVNRITFCYIIFLSLYSISTRFVPTAILCEGPAADILYKTVIIGGGVLSLLYLWLLKNVIKPGAHLFLLAGFTVILAISTLLNYKYELAGNILGMATFVSQLIIFYFLPLLMPKAQLVKCIKYTALFTSFFWTIGCISSLYQYIKNIHYTTISPENLRIRQGIVDGRLFGLFSDPNFAAFTSLIIIILLIYTITHTKIKALKRYGMFSIFINVCYLIMSNSRTIYITALGVLFVSVILITYNTLKTDRAFNTKTFLLVSGKRLFFAVFGVIAIYSIIFFPMRQIGQLMEPERSVNDMVRDDVTTDNITNNRSTIWKNYFSLYKEKPVFGFSIRSALPYVTDNYPDSYLAKTQYVTHNSYISLLIETGFMGFGVMGAFFLLTFLQSLKRIRQKEKISSSYLLFVALIVAVLIFLMCFHDVFFTVNIETMLLYIGVGFLCKANSAMPVRTSPEKSSPRSGLSTD